MLFLVFFAVLELNFSRSQSGSKVQSWNNQGAVYILVNFTGLYNLYQGYCGPWNNAYINIVATRLLAISRERGHLEKSWISWPLLRLLQFWWRVRWTGRGRRLWQGQGQGRGRVGVKWVWWRTCGMRRKRDSPPDWATTSCTWPFSTSPLLCSSSPSLLYPHLPVSLSLSLSLSLPAVPSPT